MSTEQRRPSRLPPLLWSLGLLGVLLLGAWLRLVWPEDMEYKGDERWTYEQVRRIHAPEELPWLGMPSSQDVLNPGMSLWVFVGLGKLARIEDPVDLARVVQVTNVAALGGLVLLALGVVGRGEREYWLWAAALVAVNPLAVLFHRKIWPPSVLPLLVVLFLLCWHRRHRGLAAFTWGLVGACLGQIHIPGFFFALGFVLWAVCFARRLVAWRAWLAGSCLGALPLLPWLHYLATDARLRPGDPGSWAHALEGKFWLRWVLEPMGMGLEYALGRDYLDFLGHPLWRGRPTWLCLLLHVVLLAAGLVILGQAGRRLWLVRGRWGALWVGRPSASAFTVAAALWGYGLLLTFSCFSIHRHYMIILFPLQLLWLARLALGGEGGREGVRLGRALLLTLVVGQALLSVGFLRYVHQADHIRGDYGVPYSKQLGPEGGPAAAEGPGAVSPLASAGGPRPRGGQPSRAGR